MYKSDFFKHLANLPLSTGWICTSVEQMEVITDKLKDKYGNSIMFKLDPEFPDIREHFEISFYGDCDLMKDLKDFGYNVIEVTQVNFELGQAYMNLVQITKLNPVYTKTCDLEGYQPLLHTRWSSKSIYYNVDKYGVLFVAMEKVKNAAQNVVCSHYVHGISLSSMYTLLSHVEENYEEYIYTPAWNPFDQSVPSYVKEAFETLFGEDGQKFI